MHLMLGLAGVLVVAQLASSKVQRNVSTRCLPADETIYDFVGEDIWTKEVVPLSKYRDKQEPGANATEIMNGIKYVRPGNLFEPNFQMFSKIEVNGEKEHPLYTYLKNYCPPTRDGYESKDMLFYQPLMNSDIRWNFEKFLIDHSGRPVKRYDGSTPPHVIDQDIQDISISSSNQTNG